MTRGRAASGPVIGERSGAGARLEAVATPGAAVRTGQGPGSGAR